MSCTVLVNPRKTFANLGMELGADVDILSLPICHFCKQDIWASVCLRSSIWPSLAYFLMSLQQCVLTDTLNSATREQRCFCAPFVIDVFVCVGVILNLLICPLVFRISIDMVSPGRGEAV